MTSATRPNGACSVHNDYSSRSKIYDLEYTSDADLPFWTRLTEHVDTVLELPSGSGKRAIHLAEAGKKVTAVDLEPNMVGLLRRKLADHGPGLSVRPVVADMRTLDLGAAFDAILVIREGFQFLLDDDDVVRTLRSFSRHLDDDGFIAIDLADFSASVRSSPYFLGYYDEQEPDGAWIDDWRRVTADSRGVCTRRRRQNRQPDGTVVVEFEYSLCTANAPPQEWRASVRYRRYDRQQFLRLAAQSGLRCRDLFGDYDHKPYESGDPRMIFILRK